MSEAHWIGTRLFLGRIIIGGISNSWGSNPADKGKWAAFCYLPGAACFLGLSDTPEDARTLVLRSAQSRVKGMFGAGIDTTCGAVRDGRALRTIARTIWRAGNWTCDRPVKAEAMFLTLRRALGIPQGEIPGAHAAAPQGVDAGRFPEDGDLIENERNSA